MLKYYFLLSVCILLSGCTSTHHFQENADSNQDNNAMLTARVENVTVKANDVVAKVSLFNNSSRTINIVKMSGACSCFSGYSGDKVINPGKKGRIEVYFDTNKLASGRHTKKLRIETGDPDQSIKEVELAFTVKRTAEEEDRWLVRNELANMRKEMLSLRNEIRKGNQGNQKDTAKTPVDTKVYSIDIGNSPVLGPENAPVTIVEFFDMQCSYCIREHPKIKQILTEYPDKVRFVVKHYPLNFHKEAPAAHAALLLALQEKGPDSYWKMHEMIIGNPQNLAPEHFAVYATALGLNVETFNAVLSDKTKVDDMLKADKSAARECNVRGTPTVFINGLKLQNRSLEGYRERINSILVQ